MFFAQSPRCLYRNHQLGDVICQLRFPEILTVETTLPAQFQEAIREDFPGYSVRKEAPAPRLTGAPGNLSVQNSPATNNYQFVSEDGAWRVNLTSRFISLACARYPGWEEFAAWLDKPLVALIQVYHPAYFERIGLRYINLISRKRLDLEDTPFRELFTPSYLGLLAEEDVPEQSTSQCTTDVELAIRGGCRAKIHAGPGMVKTAGQVQDREVKFIFDQDLFMPGKIAVNLAAGALETLHSQAFSIFRGAITDTLHDALGPEML